MPSADPVTVAVISGLDRELRAKILSRRENMLRELRFLREQRDEMLATVVAAGWSENRLSALCGLNAFYQLVIGPLASSAKDRFGILGMEMPILHGETRFDHERTARLRAAHMAFMAALTDVPKAHRIMTAPHLSDLVYRLAKAVEEHRNE
jgi:hypothetical protein